jgi:glycosyltransferase involved in cell wall biosynthesis
LSGGPAKMSLLEVVESCSAGVGRHVAGLCSGLASEGHRVTVAYSPHRLDDTFRRFMEVHPGIRFLPLDIRREISPLSDARGVAQLLRHIRREGPFDVVHGHSSKGGAIARLAGRLAGIPTVYTPHSLIISSPEIPRIKAATYGLVELALGRLATSRIISVSGDEGEFVSRLKLIPDRRIAVIENAIEDRSFEDFAGGESLEAVDESRPLTFGSTMRFSPQKAPGNLIKAFVRLGELLPDLPTRLVIAGDGELFEEAGGQAEASGMNGRISLLGWRSDIEEVLQGLDVLVVSSLYESGLSYSTMEAMAAKLPIVSTSVFGTKGTLSRVPGNILVPVGDPVGLAEGMRRMATLSEPESLRRELRRIGQANRGYVRRRFRRSYINRRTLELYQELI